MTLRMSFRAMTAQPVRSAVLVCGFGLGIASMAGLLGVGEVILEQSHSPALRGGGDLVVFGTTGRVDNARYLISQVFESPPFADRVAAASPSMRATLYLLDDSGEPTAIRARGGIPSLERALADSETSGVAGWTDARTDEAWVSPSDGDLLRAMDRFHPIPDSPQRMDSWAEWLYFNGGGDDAQFYLTFLIGPRTGGGREAGIRLQLEHDGQVRSFVDRAVIPGEEILRGAPDLMIGGSRVELRGLEYHIELALYDPTKKTLDGEPDLTGTITLQAVAGRSLPPFEIHGANGWVSGYVVPVLSGRVHGAVKVDGQSIPLDGEGYHDHNWGFWEGVTWQWGQVAHDDLSFVYGRIRPPADAADPDRVPGLLVALGPDGPLGFASDVGIEETDGPDNRPDRILVEVDSPSLQLQFDFVVESAVRSRFDGSPLGDRTGAGEFLQLRGQYRVKGTIGERAVDFTEAGVAETFRFVDDGAVRN